MSTLSAQPSSDFELAEQGGTNSTKTLISTALPAGDESNPGEALSTHALGATANDDERKVPPPPGETSHDLGPKLENGAPRSENNHLNTKASDGPDVRTIRGIKVRELFEVQSHGIAPRLTDLRLQWFLAYSSLLSTVLFYALDGTIVSKSLRDVVTEPF